MAYRLVILRNNLVVFRQDFSDRDFALRFAREYVEKHRRPFEVWDYMILDSVN